MEWTVPKKKQQENESLLKLTSLNQSSRREKRPSKLSSEQLNQISENSILEERPRRPLLFKDQWSHFYLTPQGKKIRTGLLKGGANLSRGSGDIKPQVITFDTGLAAAVDDYRINTLALPVPRFGTTKKKATIFEILWVDWYLSIENQADTSTAEIGFLTTDPVRSNGDTTSIASFAEDVADTRTLAPCLRFSDITTSGATRSSYPKRIPLTDSAGNGVLIATDKLTICCGGIGNTTSASRAIAKVGYRLSNVGIEEYVGIVQSQQ